MQPLTRALDVACALAQASNGLTLQQLCNRLPVPAGSMHRLLGVLQEERFVTRAEGSTRYFIGPAAWEIGRNVRAATRSLPKRALGLLPELAETLGLPVHFAELRDGRAVCAWSSGDGHDVPPAPAVQAGSPLPLHATASARALMVDLERYQIRQLLSTAEFTPYTPRTPRGVPEVLERVAFTRTHGYNVAHGEWDGRTWALSASVRGGAGQVIGSVTVATRQTRPALRVARDRVRREVLRTAAAMSAELGWCPAPTAASSPAAA
ncbi:hypothetical protein N566_04870 [Streptomycetaceae bacterium MP113-05]|nr:hypothetical protein N566_04870 [Streptomycetaceae bacterium MP113-05]